MSQLMIFLAVCLAAFAKDDFPSRWRRSNDNGNNSLISTYNTNSEKCCSGIAFPLVQSEECCGSKTFNPKTQQCCNGIVHDIQTDFECCETNYVNTNTDVCCVSYFTGEYKIVKMPQGGTRSTVKCCGSNSYNTQTHECCAKRRNLEQHFKQLPSGRSSEFSKDFENESNYIKMMRKPSQIRFLEMLKWVPIFKIQEKIGGNSGGCPNEIFDRTAISLYAEEFHPQAINRDELYELMSRQKVKVDFKCNGEVFNHYTHICCSVKKEDGVVESKLHRKVSPLTGCCGLEPFSFEFEICCSERKVHQQNEDGTLACNGDEIYDVTQQQLCGMSHTLVEFNSLKDGMDSCCGDNKIPFNSKTHSCCGGKLIDDGQASENKLCCWSEDSGEEPQMYSPDREVCCGGVVFDKAHNHECCGKILFSMYSQLCCNGNVFSKTSRYGESCCGDKVYSRTTHSCCYPNRNVIEKKSKDDVDCCGDISFNGETEMCCYKGDIVTMNITMAVHPKTSLSMACCQMTPFDQKTHKCCGESVVDIGKECCEYKTPYDQKTERCCNGTVVAATSEQNQCCGRSAYNPEKELCCNDQVYPIDGNKKNCCNRDVYDDKKQICCRGTVKDVEDPLLASCCYENV